MSVLAPSLFDFLQAIADTSATRLVVEHSWLDTLANIAQSLVSILIMVMLVMGVVLLYALRKSIDELSKLVRSANAPLQEALSEARLVTNEVRAIASSLKAPLALAGETLEDASERVQDVMDVVEGRLARFDSLVGIAQDEAEGAVIGAAVAAARGARRRKRGQRSTGPEPAAPDGSAGARATTATGDAKRRRRSTASAPAARPPRTRPTTRRRRAFVRAPWHIRRPLGDVRVPFVAMLLAALALVALVPSDAWAWTPGTHVFLGEALLRSSSLLPTATAELLRAFPYDFLYGSIAADTSIAKKYAAAGRHCHSWTVGFEILERARDEPLRAFSLGYLAHLAADVIAHNYFVPRQLAITSSTAALGHSYWENRFETHLGERPARRARELILLDHTRSDGHLDRILSPDDLQHAHQPPDLPRDGARDRHGVVAADLPDRRRAVALGLADARSG